MSTSEPPSIPKPEVLIKKDDGTPDGQEYSVLAVSEASPTIPYNVKSGDPIPIPDGLPQEGNQFTFRAVAVGCLLGSIVQASNMYLGLKTGHSPRPKFPSLVVTLAHGRTVLFKQQLLPVVDWGFCSPLVYPRCINWAYYRRIPKMTLLNLYCLPWPAHSSEWPSPYPCENITFCVKNYSFPHPPRLLLRFIDFIRDQRGKK